MKDRYLGKWRIREMEQWDKDFIDLVVERTHHVQTWEQRLTSIRRY